MVGPDIDADGYRDIFAAGLWGNRFDLYVDALSGKDGRSLWTSWKQQTPHRDQALAERYVRRLDWWSPDGDGWPRLLVATGTEQRGEGGSAITIFSAATGKVLDDAGEFEQFDFADLDGDGQQELIRYHPHDARRGDGGGAVTAFSGVPRERWRWFGTDWHATADFDGDGLRDLTRVSDTGSLSAVSAASGQLLWRNQMGRAPVGLITEAGEDLNGDGAPDLLFLNQGGRVGLARRLHALSSKNGRTIWTANFESHNIHGPAALLTAADLDADGKPEVVLIAAMDEGAAKAGKIELWLIVLSGESGAVRWKRSLAAESRIERGIRYNVDVHGLQFEPNFWDLDGDGVRDIVVPTVSSANGAMALAAIDGRQGRTIWEHAFAGSRQTNRPLHSVSATVDDLDSDGKPEVYLLKFEDDVVETDQGKTRVVTTKARLRALKAADGQPLWNWKTDVAFHSGEVSERRWAERPMPHILRRTDGQHLICLNLSRTLGNLGGGEIVSLNVHGKEVSRIAVAIGWNHFRIWTDDLNGDGQGDLLFLDRDTLRAVDLLTTSRLWEAPVSGLFGSSQLLGALPSRRGPACFVVWEPASIRGTRGLDGANGDCRWALATPDAALPSSLRDHVLDLQATDSPPTLQYVIQGATVCRRAYPVTQAATAGAPVATFPPKSRDPRLARSLPWQLPRPASDELPSFAAWAAFYGVTLWVLPAAGLWWTFRHFRWSLRSLALLHLIGAVFLTACMLEAPENNVISHFGRFVTGATALPVAFTIGLITRSAIKHRWRQLRAWLVLSVALALALAAWALGRDWPLHTDGEYYSFQGWYWIWLAAAYVICVIVPLVYAARTVGRWYNRRCQVVLASGA